MECGRPGPVELELGGVDNMTPERIEYRGYKLNISQRGSGWAGFIRAPGAEFADAEFAAAPDREGCIAKAKEIVDDLIKRG